VYRYRKKKSENGRSNKLSSGKKSAVIGQAADNQNKGFVRQPSLACLAAKSLSVLYPT